MCCVLSTSVTSYNGNNVVANKLIMKMLFRQNITVITAHVTLLF